MCAHDAQNSTFARELSCVDIMCIALLAIINMHFVFRAFV
jgi:hypothetical protein